MHSAMEAAHGRLAFINASQVCLRSHDAAPHAGLRCTVWAASKRHRTLLVISPCICFGISHGNSCGCAPPMSQLHCAPNKAHPCPTCCLTPVPPVSEPLRTCGPLVSFHLQSCLPVLRRNFNFVPMRISIPQRYRFVFLSGPALMHRLCITATCAAACTAAAGRPQLAFWQCSHAPSACLRLFLVRPPVLRCAVTWNAVSALLWFLLLTPLHVGPCLSLQFLCQHTQLHI
mmetsp:Transcript_12941/g.22377  ORF Transcript_12941/g.22377 Transcript_12941/m.22377 type:complete len:230 (-) Transcript_12941:134-823(-)